jgi:lipopolysaccharide transport system permease protein
LTIPLATVLAGLVDFALAFPLLFALMWRNGITPSIQVFWLPLFVALAFATALGVGLWLSALNVEFRDVRHVVPFLTQLWMFATPIAYPSSLLPEKVARALRPEPDGRCRGRFSMGTARNVDQAGTHDLRLGARGSGIARQRSILLRRMERTFADVV